MEVMVASAEAPGNADDGTQEAAKEATPPPEAPVEDAIDTQQNAQSETTNTIDSSDNTGENTNSALTPGINAEAPGDVAANNGNNENNNDTVPTDNEANIAADPSAVDSKSEAADTGKADAVDKTETADASPAEPKGDATTDQVRLGHTLRNQSTLLPFCALNCNCATRIAAPAQSEPADTKPSEQAEPVSTPNQELRESACVTVHSIHKTLTQMYS